MKTDRTESECVRIYLAGKIGKNDWRHNIVEGLRGAISNGWEPWSTLKGALFGHDYVGPFFIGCDHGCYHGPNSHGVGVNRKVWCGEGEPPRAEVAKACLSAIDGADLIYGWIEAGDCYGTLFELGYAYAKVKPVVIAFKNTMGILEHRDLWFLREAASLPSVHPDLRPSIEREPTGKLRLAIDVVLKERRADMAERRSKSAAGSVAG